MGSDGRGLRVGRELRSAAERAAMPVGERLHGIAEITQQMPAIRNLDGIRCTLASTVGVGTGAWFRICLFRVTQACRKRRPVRAGLRPEGCPVREAARLPVVKPAGAEAIPGPAG